MERCPVWKSTEGVREYLYGMSSKELDPSGLVIGGCLIEETVPDYRCITCSADFYKDSRKYHNRFIDDGIGLVWVKRLP
jgi:hypothetical protein